MTNKAILNAYFPQNETLLYSFYYAPRGRPRMYNLGTQLAQRYLQPTDLIIGIIGAEGAGKSTLIKGLFPGLELTNDDDGVNVKTAPIYDFTPDNYFAAHTFHLDLRYELAFHQPFEIIEAVNLAVSNGRRVIMEHFDLIYDQLGYNAQIIFGIGEEVIVTRPTLFGPFPAEIKKHVDKTAIYRRMAHSAEDITSYILMRDYNYTQKVFHSDIKHGFVIKFIEQPYIDIQELEAKVSKAIASNLAIEHGGPDKVRIGEWEMVCTGSRTHVKNTSEITNFRLWQEYIYEPILQEYLLVGLIGPRKAVNFKNINYFEPDVENSSQVL
jgi:tRNA A37 threonylcarbamoyladenosine biosynthesis protein TsaE